MEKPTDKDKIRLEIFEGDLWKTPNGKRLARLLSDKTFVTRFFDTESVSKLVDALIQQYLPYFAALKSARVSFTNLDTLQCYYIDRAAKSAEGEETVSGCDIAKEINNELFEPIAIRRVLPGTTFELVFDARETKRLEKLTFKIDEVPPHNNLKQFAQ